jgi:hypothetical protein
VKKITDLREGDLLTAEAASKLLGCTVKYLYTSHSKSKHDPSKYIRGVKLGGKLFFLKSNILEYLNRQLSVAS